MNLPLADALIVYARVCSSDTTGVEWYRRQPFYKPELAGYRESHVTTSDEVEIAEQIARIVKRLEARSKEDALALRCKLGAYPGGRSQSPQARFDVFRRETGLSRRELYRMAARAEVYVAGAYEA